MVSDSADTVSVVLRNGLGMDINPITVAISGTACAAAQVDSGGGANDDCAVVADCGGAGTCTLANGELCTYVADCSAGGGITAGKFSEDITIGYTNADTGLTHSVTGTITGRAE